jgi:chromate transporter
LRPGAAGAAPADHAVDDRPGTGPPPGRGPSSPAALFLAFNRLALQGFGGVLPVAQRELVERLGWLTRADFVALLSIGQVLPGPNIVNMALIYGDRHFGWRGAAAATAGLLLAPTAVVLVLAVLARELADWPAVQGALRGMGMAAAALVLSIAWKSAATLRGNVIGLPACVALLAATVLAIGGLRWPLALVLALVGPLAWWLAWRQLGAVPR